MNKRDFSLNSINQSISEIIKHNDLDFCKLLALEYEKDLSIIAKYDPPRGFVSLAKDGLETGKYYYGVSPCLDGRELIGCISRLELQTTDDLERYIEKHGDWFTVRQTHREYLPTLAKYIVICMASHFGIRIEADNSGYAAFRDYLLGCGYSAAGIEKMAPFVTSKSGRAFMIIKGCPTDRMMAFLDGFAYEETAIALDDRKKGGKKPPVRAWKMLGPKAGAKGESPKAPTLGIRDIYAKHVELIEGKVFYSGVLIKPTRFELIDQSVENEKIQSLCIHFEPTTYGTVCAFDRNLTEHALLCDVKSEIIGMLKKDDAVKRELAEKFANIQGMDLADSQIGSNMIEAVNEYLNHSSNVNQICVSANIVTRDGMLLLGQRDDANIDDGKLYPGVNGNAEIADRQVSFYNLSVYEDYPTISTDKDRIDFFGEIGRETYGELKLNLSEREWVCRGIALSGNMPGKVDEAEIYAEPFRRMHFNIIFEHGTDKSFQDVRKNSAKAVEAFETKRYLGVRVQCERNRLAYFIKAIGKSITGIVKQKDFIEAVAALIIFLVTVTNAVPSKGQEEGAKFFGVTWTNALALVLSLLIVALSFIRVLKSLYQLFLRRRQTLSVRVYSGMSYRDVSKRVMRALGRFKTGEGTYALHPVAYACLRNFIDSLAYDAFFRRDVR